MNDTMRVLVTNDDGLSAPGLRALAEAALQQGWEVVVAAPARETSGSSAAMTAVEADGRVAFERLVLDGLEAVTVFSVSASPAYIALLAMRDVFGAAPAVVLSGVNRGANLGTAVLHSGTVGAALTAAANGARAVAVSLDVLAAPAKPVAAGGPTVANVSNAPDASRHWHGAARLAVDAVPWLMDAPLGMVLNLNVPDLPPDRVRGVRRGRLATFGQTQMMVAESAEGFVKLALALPDEPVKAGTDIAWLAEGYASVTPIRGPAEAVDVALPW
jgi:5'-nucleotidase